MALHNWRTTQIPRRFRLSTCLHLASKTSSHTTFPLRERQEARIFQELLKLCYGLEDRLADAEPEEVQLIGDLVRMPSAVNCCRNYIITTQIQKGINASRADDTKGMKGTILEWITPSDGELVPKLHRKHKFDRGFQHETTGSLLCPAGVDWSNAE